MRVLDLFGLNLFSLDLPIYFLLYNCGADNGVSRIVLLLDVGVINLYNFGFGKILLIVMIFETGTIAGDINELCERIGLFFRGDVRKMMGFLVIEVDEDD